MAGGGDGSVKVILFALVANGGIALSKFFGAFYSGSASLLAEAIHSTVDCANQVLLLIGGRAAKKAPDERHPLGYGREAFFWSFVVAILLFSAGGLFAIYEGIHKLSEVQEVGSPWLGLGILLFGIVLETFSFIACIREVRRQNPYPSLWQWFRKTTASELLVIFTEDAAAMAGLVLAAIFLLLAWWTGDARWDATGSIVIGAILIVVAILLAIEIKSLLIGEAPATDYRSMINELCLSRGKDMKVLRLIALQTGASEVMLSMKLTPGRATVVRELVDEINLIESAIKQKYPEIKWLFVEPDFVE